METVQLARHKVRWTRKRGKEREGKRELSPLYKIKKNNIFPIVNCTGPICIAKSWSQSWSQNFSRFMAIKCRQLLWPLCVNCFLKAVDKKLHTNGFPPWENERRVGHKNDLARASYISIVLYIANKSAQFPFVPALYRPELIIFPYIK